MNEIGLISIHSQGIFKCTAPEHLMCLACWGFSPTKDMHIPSLSFASILMEDAQCTEANEKFAFWVIVNFVHNIQVFLP